MKEYRSEALCSMESKAGSVMIQASRVDRFEQAQYYAVTTIDQISGDVIDDTVWLIKDYEEAEECHDAAIEYWNRACERYTKAPDASDDSITGSVAVLEYLPMTDEFKILIPAEVMVEMLDGRSDTIAFNEPEEYVGKCFTVM